jgi:hypothetical protein
MKISTMLYNHKNPMALVNHPDFSRASWLAKSNGVPTPIDAVLNNQHEITAKKLNELGL